MERLMQDIRTALPEDWKEYPQALFEEFAAHAALLRRTSPFCAGLDEELFFQYILCPRVNDEDLSSHRPLFYRLLWERVKDLTVREAVLEVNRWCHEHASYQAQDDRTASPLTVFRAGSGRCGEESAFLVAALRSVGIPARQVYAPRWSHCDDNHAWVEALCEGQWCFLGACEPEPILNRGWFNTAASRAMLVRSRTFGPAEHPLHGAPLDRRGTLTFHNQTGRYAVTKPYTFRLTLPDGTPAAGAEVLLSVLNEADFRPIAALEAGQDGCVRVELGIGDLYLSARKDGCRAEGLCRGEERDGLTLTLLPGEPAQHAWRDFDFHAPADNPRNPAPLTAEQKLARIAELKRGREVREARLAGFYQAARGAACPREAGLLRSARGNFDELCSFLERDGDPLRPALLHTLSEKDLRDVRADVLEAHLRRAKPFAPEYPEEIFRRYVLCPRVAFERLTDWSVLPEGEVGQVAALRKRGIPARLRPLDGAVERWQDGAFVPQGPERTGTVVFHRRRGAQLRYRSHWSVSRWDGERWQPLDLSSCAWREDRCSASLSVGLYRVITAIRMPVGTQFASVCRFAVAENAVTELELRLRESKMEDLLFCRALALDDDRPVQGRARLLLWLEEGAEPTEHLLGELYASVEGFRVLPAEVTVTLRREEGAEQATLARLLSAWPEIHIRRGDWSYELESLSRYFGCDPERPPLCIVCDEEGSAVYAASGYRVGAVDLLRRITEHLCRMKEGPEKSSRIPRQ